ncbi:MAG: hypothetical protein ABIN93_11170 [Ginsengibacter sp.]
MSCSTSGSGERHGWGLTIAQFCTGEVPRLEAPYWRRYMAIFTTPPSETALTLTMINNNPGGCGNDFALDDITFRECVQQIPLAITAPKIPGVAKKPHLILNRLPKKATSMPVKNEAPIVQIIKPQKDTQVYSTPVLKQMAVGFPTPPPVLTTRENALVKRIETEAGEIIINLYDNAEIDGDSVSVYHNNVQLMEHARLSEKPLTIRITIDPSHPHHELIMVAENLGSIPPNTSLMIITAGTRRYEVFISSNEKKNAKVVLDLKE